MDGAGGSGSPDEGGGDARTDGAADGAAAGTGPTCPRCGAELFRRHCKYVCPQHGVVMDCGDTFWV